MNYNITENRNAPDVFHAGDSTHAYDFFGAHLDSRDGVDGVVFRVWAPNALSVAVVGDFNDRDNNTNQMTNLGDGIWETFISGAKQYDSYRFCIETPSFEKVMKSDPFAFYSEIRPDNASLVYDLDGYAWGDEDWLESRLEKNIKKQPLNIYEIHAGSWKKFSDNSSYGYRKLADELAEYLKDMNYTHVQFMPLTEFPLDKSWGFQTTGYFAATSRYGTPHDLMYLVDRLHRAGIGVFMDWVPSNFPKDSGGLYKFDGTSLFENEDPIMGERPSWGTALFDYSKYEVISFLVSSAVFWIEKFHIDGIRIGALSSMLYLDFGKEEGEWKPNKFGGKENLEAIDFIKRLNTAVHILYPDVAVFAEENTSWPKLSHPIEEGGLGFDFKWNMGWINDVLNYMSLPMEWRPFNHDNLTYSFFYAFSEEFLLPVSHDEVSHGKGSLLDKMPGDIDEKFAGVRAFVTYMFAHPGKKLVFMGSEIGQQGEWDCMSAINWELLSEEKNAQLQSFFRAINKFYLENTPLYELDSSWKGFDWIHHDDFTNSVIAFKRTDTEGNEIIAVCNFQPVKHDSYFIGVPEYGLYDEVFTSDAVEFGGTGVSNGRSIKPELMKIHGCNQGLSLTLPPLGVIYLRCTQRLDSEGQGAE